jgi:hypothetical protein
VTVARLELGQIGTPREGALAEARVERGPEIAEAVQVLVLAAPLRQAAGATPALIVPAGCRLVDQVPGELPDDERRAGPQ